MTTTLINKPHAGIVSPDTIIHLPPAAIGNNPCQPRQAFDQAALDDLAASIRQHGILQPLTVARGEDGEYTLIAGERRLRAARLIGLEAVPAIVRDGDPAILALVENVQRQDLNPLEEARGWQSWMAISVWYASA